MIEWRDFVLEIKRECKRIGLVLIIELHFTSYEFKSRRG